MYILHIDTFKYNTNAPHSLTLLYLKIMHSWAPRTVRSAAPAPGTPYPQTEIYFDAHQVIDKYETFNGHLAKDLLLHKHRTCFIPGLPRGRGRRGPRPRNRGSSHRIAPRPRPALQPLELTSDRREDALEAFEAFVVSEALEVVEAAVGV